MTLTAEAPAATRPRFRHERNLGAVSQTWDLPVDVAIAGDGRVYVLHRARSATETSAPRVPDAFAGHIYERRLVDRVSIWTFDDEPVDKPIQRFGGGRGELIWPAGVATDDERVYITDEATHDVRVFDLEGNHLETWGRPGAGEGELRSPAGIAIDQEGNVLVVDSANHRLQRFTPHGRPLGRWGERGSASGQFERPWGVAVDARGDVYVSDWGNDRAQKFSADGRWLATFGSSGSGDGQLRRPAGVAVDGFGCVYVADSANDRVAVFAPDGSHYATLLGDATLGKWAIQYLFGHPPMAAQRATAAAELARVEHGLLHPRGVKIDRVGRVLVADSDRHRIQVYERLAVDLPPIERVKGDKSARSAKAAPARLDVDESITAASRVSPVLGTFLRAWERSAIGSARDDLQSYAKRIARLTPSAGDDERRGWLATDWLVRTAAPAWLGVALVHDYTEIVWHSDSQRGSRASSAGLAEHAARLRALPELTSSSDVAQALELVNTARDAAYEAAWSAGSDRPHYSAYDAARAQIWPAAAAAASEELAIGARNIAGAGAWAAATETDLSGTRSDLGKSILDLLDRMIKVGEVRA